MARIDLRVKRGGRVQADFVGFVGSKCVSEARALEEALRRFGLRATLLEERVKNREELLQELGGEERSRGASAGETR